MTVATINEKEILNNIELFREKQGVFYLLIVWSIGVWACVSNVVRAIPRKIFYPRKSFLAILWEMGRNKQHYSGLFIDRISRLAHKIKVNAASYRALECFYDFDSKYKNNGESQIDKFVTNFWMNADNCRAIRNRKKIITSILAEKFETFDRNHEIIFFSLASGSAQAVIDAVKSIPNLKIQVHLIDLDQGALKDAKKLVKEEGIADKFFFYNESVSYIETLCESGLNPDIVEMAGFLDYRTDQQAIRLIKKIYNCLSDKGFFLSCHINDNPERLFISWGFLWFMKYRTKEELVDLAQNGGFNPKKIEAFYEPLKIHSIVCCDK